MERVLTALLYARGKERGLHDLRDYSESFFNRSGSKLDNVLDVILHRRVYEDETLDDMIALLVDRLSEINSGTKEDADLIDAMVQALQLPYARSTFSARTFLALRKALLLPSEMTAVTTRIKQREISCGGCNHVFRRGEMITFSAEGTDVVMLCTRCQLPVYMSCKNCDRTIAIDKKLSTALNKTVDCGCSKEGKLKDAAEVVEPAEPDMEELLGRRDVPGAAPAAARPVFAPFDAEQPTQPTPVPTGTTTNVFTLPNTARIQFTGADPQIHYWDPGPLRGGITTANTPPPPGLPAEDPVAWARNLLIPRRAHTLMDAVRGHTWPTEPPQTTRQVDDLDEDADGIDGDGDDGEPDHDLD